MTDASQTSAQSMAPYEQKFVSVRQLLMQNKEQLGLALPKLLKPDRLIRLAMTEVARTPKLLECEPASLMGAVLQCAQLGLEPGVMGDAYLIPFWNSKRRRTEVQFMPGYKGLLKLARRSGDISTIDAHEVRAEDYFEYQFGLDAVLKHKPAKTKDRGEIVYFYACARLKDGGTQFDVMTREEIDEHRDKYSQAAQSGPWVSNYREMGLKTVLRRLCKLLPASVELQTAVALDEYAESQIPQGLTALTGHVEESEEEVEVRHAQADLADVQAKLQAKREAAAPPPAPPAPPAEAPPSDVEAAPPSTVPVLNFGKHAGKPLTDDSIPLDYLQWLEDSLDNEIQDPKKAKWAEDKKRLKQQVYAEINRRAAQSMSAEAEQAPLEGDPVPWYDDTAAWQQWCEDQSGSPEFADARKAMKLSREQRAKDLPVEKRAEFLKMMGHA